MPTGWKPVATSTFVAVGVPPTASFEGQISPVFEAVGGTPTATGNDPPTGLFVAVGVPPTASFEGQISPFFEAVGGDAHRYGKRSGFS